MLLFHLGWTFAIAFELVFHSAKSIVFKKSKITPPDYLPRAILSIIFHRFSLLFTGCQFVLEFNSKFYFLLINQFIMLVLCICVLRLITLLVLLATQLLLPLSFLELILNLLVTGLSLLWVPGSGILSLLIYVLLLILILLSLG